MNAMWPGGGGVMWQGLGLLAGAPTAASQMWIAEPQNFTTIALRKIAFMMRQVGVGRKSLSGIQCPPHH